MRSLAALRRPPVRNEQPAPAVSRHNGQHGALYQGQSVGGSSTDRREQLAAMGGSGTLYGIIDATSTATAAAGWDLYRLPADGRPVPEEERDVVRPAQHAAAALWHRPNPFFTRQLLVESVQQHIDLAAEGYMLVVKALGIPIELWPARPDRMYPVPHATKYLAGWIYLSPDGERIPFEVDEVIQIRKPDPLDPYRGLSAVAALGVDLDAERFAAQWNKNFFLNSAEPGGVIELPTHLSDTQWDEFTARWREQHQGVARAHRVGVIEYGGKYVPRSVTQRDMQFAELREVSRDVLMTAYRMSKTALGISDDVNRATALAARDQMSRTLTVPRLGRWEQALNHQLLPMFGETGAAVAFGFHSPVEEDEEAANAERNSKAEAAAIYITSGWNPDSVKEALGLPDQLFYGTIDKPDPDRDLLIKLVTTSPASLAGLILPMLGFTLPEQPLDTTKGLAYSPPGDVDDDVPDESDPDDPSVPGTAPAVEDVPDESDPPVPRTDDAAAARATPNVRAEGELAGMSQAWDAALAQLMAAWPGITTAWRAELYDLIVAAVNGDAPAELGNLDVDTDDARDLLLRVLTELARGAATAVVAEYSQVPLTAAPPADAAPVATTVAVLLAAELATAAGREALRLYTPGASGADVARAVDDLIALRSVAPARAQLGGALTGAQNRARIDTMASGPVGSIYANEILDGATCGPCTAVHGRFVCTTDDLAPYDLLYTSLGGYVGCEGGIRCRGTVTGVWRPTTTTEDS